MESLETLQSHTQRLAQSRKEGSQAWLLAPMQRDGRKVPAVSSRRNGCKITCRPQLSSWQDFFFLMYKEKEKAAHRMCVCEMNAVCVRMSHRRIRARKGCADSGLPDS